MLKCNEAEELISLRIDGESLSAVSPDEAPDEALERHLSSCAACREFAREEASRSRNLLAALSVPGERVDALAERVLAEASSAISSAAAPRFRLAPVFAFAACFVLGFSLWLVSPWAFAPGSEGSGDAGVIFVRSSSIDATDAGAIGADGTPIRVRTETDKSFLMDVPAPDRSPGELILELEHIDRRLVQPVSNTWQ